MNGVAACQCLITLSLVSIGVPIQVPAFAASGSDAQLSASPGSHDGRKPATAAHPDGTTRETTPTGRTRQALTPHNRAQEVEERVRSGQMEQPIAQGEISERLNQLQSGLSNFSDGTSSRQSNR